MKNKELRSYSPEQLQEKLRELQQEHLKMRIQISTGTAPKSPSRVKNVRKLIARIHTIMHTPQAAPAKKTKEVTKQ